MTLASYTHQDPFSRMATAIPEDSLKTLLRSLPSLKGPFCNSNITDLPDTPHEAFKNWLQDAVKEGIKEPHAMTLSTVDSTGHPDARILILKNLDSRGWHFAIKSDSPKGEQIIACPAVALTFYWPQLGRQIRIKGQARQLSKPECADDFLKRPFDARATAVASRQSELMEKSSSLTTRIAEAQSFLESDSLYVAPSWRVYAVAPSLVEFWQGSADRLHKRLRYEQQGSQWVRSLLYP